MDLRAIALGLSFALFWSSAFTSARIIVADAPPLTALMLRFVFSGIVGIALARALGQSWRLTPGQWRATIVFGICQNTLYLGLFFVAMQRIEASLAAILASTLPLVVALAGRVLFKDRLPPLAVVGLVMGFAGVIIVMGGRLSDGADYLGLILCLVGVLALTAATMALRNASSGGNVLMVVGVQMLVGAAGLVVPALLLETWDVRWSWKLVGAFSYTVFVPGLLATWIWFTLVNSVGAVRAAVFHFLNPFFGVLIAAIVLGEPFGARDMLGVAIVAAGILLVQLARAGKARPARTRPTPLS